MLKTHRLRTVEQVRCFVNGAAELDVKSVERAAGYDFVVQTWTRLGYARLGRGDKGSCASFWPRLRVCPGPRPPGSSPSTAPLGASATAAARRRVRFFDATRFTTSDCSPRSMSCTAPCPDRPPASCASAPGRYSTTHVLSAWRGSPTGICITFAIQRPTSAAEATSRRPERCISASANGAGLAPKGIRDRLRG